MVWVAPPEGIAIGVTVRDETKPGASVSVE
jgi:hypothetical protein